MKRVGTEIVRGGWSGREAGAGTNYRSSVFLSASRITHTIVGRLSHLRGRERERERERERRRAPLFEVTTDGMGTDHGRTAVVDGN